MTNDSGQREQSKHGASSGQQVADGSRELCSPPRRCRLLFLPVRPHYNETVLKNIGDAMPMTVEQIAAEALALPSEARALLADKLVESLDPAEDGYIRQLWMREAKQRVDEVRRGEVETVPAEETFAKVRQAIAR